MIVTKNPLSPEARYQLVAMLVARLGHLPGFRRPPTSKHARGRLPKPLLLESQLARLGATDALPRQERSERGMRKLALDQRTRQRIREERHNV